MLHSRNTLDNPRNAEILISTLKMRNINFEPKTLNGILCNVPIFWRKQWPIFGEISASSKGQDLYGNT